MAGPPGGSLRGGACKIPVLQADLLRRGGLGAGEGPSTAVERRLVSACCSFGHVGLQLVEVRCSVQAKPIPDKPRQVQGELGRPGGRPPVRRVYGVGHGAEAPTAEHPCQEDRTHEVRVEHSLLGPDRAPREVQGADE
eukprot:12096463-Alexandrium_andersonii.AAC.1